MVKATILRGGLLGLAAAAVLLQNLRIALTLEMNRDTKYAKLIDNMQLVEHSHHGEEKTELELAACRQLAESFRHERNEKEHKEHVNSCTKELKQKIPGVRDNSPEVKKKTKTKFKKYVRHSKKEQKVTSSPTKTRDEHCVSPEKEVVWPLKGDVASRVPTSTRTCGFQSDSNLSRFMQNHLLPVLKKFREECRDLVVHGAAFGKEHLALALNPTVPERVNSTNLLHTHGNCFFLYCLEEELAELRHTSAPERIGHTLLVPIPRTVLPYKNMRRNTKLFKFSGPQLFPFADRIVWQDVKFWRPKWLSGKASPSNYFAASYNPDACLSAMALPVHGNSNTVEYNRMPPPYTDYCHVVKAALDNGRKDVTDSGVHMAGQCEHYASTVRRGNRRQSGAAYTLDHGLIDTAFMVWNQSTEVCRKFNAELQCSILDEHHCSVDRDQVVIPYVMSFMNLQVKAQTLQNGLAYNSRWHDLQLQSIEDSDGVAVHVTKSDCHWYYRSLESCHGVYDSPSVAVMVAGGQQRYLFSSTLDHVLIPLEAQHYAADYYVSYSEKSGPAYRQSFPYMAHVVGDPFLRTNKNKYLGQKTVQANMLLKMSRSASSLRALDILREPISLKGSDALKTRREKAKKEHPDEDADLRFPMLDERPQYAEMTSNANRNVLTLFLTIQKLWDERVVAMERMTGKEYDYVMVLRDDTYWLKDFDMGKLLATNPLADAYVQSCNARVPAWRELEICDHGIVIKREKAHVVTRYFDSLLATDLKPCHEIARAEGYGIQQGCNSEMIFKWILKQNNITVHGVPQSVLPFERSARVKHPDSGKEEYCFHKYCQSKEDPLDLPNNIAKCKDLKFGGSSTKKEKRKTRRSPPKTWK